MHAEYRELTNVNKRLSVVTRYGMLSVTRRIKLNIQKDQINNLFWLYIMLLFEPMGMMQLRFAMRHIFPSITEYLTVRILFVFFAIIPTIHGFPNIIQICILMNI